MSPSRQTLSKICKGKYWIRKTTTTKFTHQMPERFYNIWKDKYASQGVAIAEEWVAVKSNYGVGVWTLPGEQTYYWGPLSERRIKVQIELKENYVFFKKTADNLEQLNDLYKKWLALQSKDLVKGFDEITFEQLPMSQQLELYGLPQHFRFYQEMGIAGYIKESGINTPVEAYVIINPDSIGTINFNLE